MKLDRPNSELAQYADVISSRAFCAVEKLKEPLVQTAVATWDALRRGRAFPCWTDIEPRRFRATLANLLVLRVVGDCEDYEFRIIGDAHLAVLGIKSFPKRLSQLDDYIPGYAATLKPLYDRVVFSRAAYGLRSDVRRASENTSSALSESAFLPVGQTDDAVDHVLVASVYHNHWATLVKRVE